MVALHLPWLGVSRWSEAMRQSGYRDIKVPIIIGTKRPAGFSTTWAHKPLSASQAFWIFRQRASLAPTHNAFRMYNKNPNGNWRTYWSDLVLLEHKEYEKSKDEIRLKVPTCTYSSVFIR
jgi:hypothetical protein